MGGLETYARELARALARRDDVELVVVASRRLRGDSLVELGRCVWVAGDPKRRLDWVLADQVAVPRAVARAGADVVHFLASTAAVAGHVARVVTVHDLAFLRHPRTHFGVRAAGMAVLVPLAAHRAERVITPSAFVADELVRFLRVPRGRVAVVHEGLGRSVDARTAAGDLPRPVAERLAARPRPLVLTASAKRPHKNLARLIRAVALIPPHRRPLLVLPGYPTPYESELRALARSLGIEGEVCLLGWVADRELDALYARASCFVFPSLYEGFGLPVLEAMARGVPVATSDRASLPEVAGDAALYFDPLSPRSIAAALERLLADENLAARLRSQGRERARRFTWDACAEGTVAVYRQALAVAGSPSRA